MKAAKARKAKEKKVREANAAKAREERKKKAREEREKRRRILERRILCSRSNKLKSNKNYDIHRRKQ